jgi:TPR repeat protein
MKKLIPFVFLVVQAYSYTLENGIDFFLQNNYKKSLIVFRSLSQMGNAKASLYLGDMYLLGRGTTKNHKKAAYYYEKAAKKGIKKAQLNLGLLYFNGSGVKKNVTKSRYWYAQARKKTYATSYYQFALQSEKNKDFRQALKWYEKAAKLDHPVSQYDLGVMYLLGIGTAKNSRKAKRWLKEAYLNGIDKAKRLLIQHNLHNY